VNEDVLAAIVTNDEAKALLTIEEFYDAGAFSDNLGRHAATATAAAAAKTAATAAAEATAATGTAAKAAAITKTAAAAAAKAASITPALATAIATAEIISKTAETFVAETVSLVLAAPAASSVKTHALLIAFVRPLLLDRTLDETHTEPPADISGQFAAITGFPSKREHFHPIY
jgi:hypothetical protein